MLRNHRLLAAVLTIIAAISHLAQAILPDRKLPDCKVQKWDFIPDKGKFWSESGAEQYAEEYLIANGGHTNWTRDLYMELFGDDAIHNQSKSFPRAALSETMLANFKTQERLLSYVLCYIKPMKTFEKWPTAGNTIAECMTVGSRCSIPQGCGKHCSSR
jgi:hypothetical protein